MDYKGDFIGKGKFENKMFETASKVFNMGNEMQPGF